MCVYVCKCTSIYMLSNLQVSILVRGRSIELILAVQNLPYDTMCAKNASLVLLKLLDQCSQTIDMEFMGNFFFGRECSV